MKTPLILISFLFITQIIIAQYIPLPMSTAKWSIKVDLYTNPDNPFLIEKRGYSYEMNGDTIIDGIEYKKISQRRTWYKSDYFEETDTEILEEHIAYNIQASPKLIGGMRQDTAAKKVYFRRLISNLNSIPCIMPMDESNMPFNEEILLYDFDVVAGDTVFLGGDEVPIIIHAIDSVQYNDGLYRKRLLPANSFPNYHFIEGIGTDVNLFAPLRALFVEGDWCNLRCFSKEDEYIIGNGIYNCDSIDVLSPIVEIDETTKLEIYPNPFNQSLEIGMESPAYRTFNITILNSLGQQQSAYSISSNEMIRVNTEGFSPGIYFLTVYDHSTLITTQKIIKSN